MSASQNTEKRSTTQQDLFQKTNYFCYKQRIYECLLRNTDTTCVATGCSLMLYHRQGDLLSHF